MENETVKTTTTKPPQFQIQAEIEGFPVTVTFRGKAYILKATVAKLKAAGATPPKAITTNATSAAPDAPPVCPIHKAKLKPSRKPGTFYCPKKDGDDYCDFKHTI